MKKILVTGADGFIGSHLVEELVRKGHKVKSIDILNGYDVTNWDSIKDIQDFDIAIHLAAITYVPRAIDAPREMFKINIEGTLNLLELCRKNGSKMIFNSSYVYGHPQKLPVVENHALESFNPYCQSKIIGEKLCESYSEDFHVPIIIFRIFNAYGEGQNNNFLIPKIINALKNNEDVYLENPTPRRDYVHIDDIIQAYIKALDNFNTECQIYNIGFGKSYSVKEIVKIIQNHFQNKVNIYFSGKMRNNEVLDTVADITKIKTHLGWQPHIPLEEGINRLVKGVRD